MDRDGRLADATTVYQSGLNDVVATLRRDGIGVAILQDIPNPPFVDQISILRRIVPATGPVSFDSTATIADRAISARTEADVASANPGTVLYDPIPWMCPSGECPLTIDGASLYLDTAHLTRDGSILLTPSLKDAIHQAAKQR
jgi:hypothetical protein